MSGRRVLVTGGSGFIGSHLCEALVAANASVRVLDNLSSGREENLASVRDRVEIRLGDVRDPEAVAAAMEGIDTVFHEAALVSVADSVARPRICHEINATGTFQVLEAARAAGVRRVVLASTAAAYGNDPALPKIETFLPQPASPYAAAKVAAEGYLRVFAELYGIETVALRYFNVYGARQDPSSPYSGVISRFLEALRRGRPLVVFGDGLQTRDFLSVADVVQANGLAAVSPNVGQGEVLNIGRGVPTSLLDVIRALGEAAGRALDPEFLPARPGDIRHSVADIGRARRLLGYEPRVELRDGLLALLSSIR
jgi:UDP-glucose 4-epimerase